MFRNDEIPSSYIKDYKTLHHDIGLVQRTNGLWDLWFGQDSISKNYEDSIYLDIIEGDIVSATEIHSLQVGIIIACLTSWNYLNRTGNPIYTEFGNESYSLLKKNKGVNTQYKIKQFFIDCLNRMRRVYRVEYLNVYDVESNPFLYKVVFKVVSVTNTLVDGEFFVETDSSKSTSVIDINYNHPYTSVSNPLFVECVLRNEYGSFIEDEIIYIYIRNGSDSEFEFAGITDATDRNGCAYVTIPPNGLSNQIQIMFVFKGNSTYNSCISKIVNIESVEYFIKSKYVPKKVDGVDVIDKHILYIEDSNGRISRDKFKLGELLSDYINIDSILASVQPPSYISSEYIQEHLISNNNPLLKDKHEIRKLYLIPTDEYITGTNQVYYNAYSWDNLSDGLNFVNGVEVQLNSDEPNEVHFLIQDKDNGFFEINFDDGHLYYRTELLDNEF